MMITKSQVHAWDTTHLDEAADHWLQVARVVEHIFNEVHDGAKAPSGTTFTGQFANGLVSKARANLNTAEDITSHLRYAANAATIGKGDQDGAKQQATEALSEADNAGFNVDESLNTVTPKQPSKDPVELAYQMHQAAQHLGTIQAAVTRLNTADLETSAGIGRAANGIHSVDFHMGGGFKTDGEQLMPDVGSEHIGGGGGRTPLEDGLGGPPGPPNDWWKNNPQEVTHCPIETAAKDVVNTATSVVGEGALIAITPGEGPLALAGGAAIIGNLANIGDNIDKLDKCIEQGIEGFE